MGSDCSMRFEKSLSWIVAILLVYFLASPVFAQPLPQNLHPPKATFNFPINPILEISSSTAETDTRSDPGSTGDTQHPVYTYTTPEASAVSLTVGASPDVSDTVTKTDVVDATLVASVFPAVSWESRTPAEVGLDSATLDRFVAQVGGRGVLVRDGYMVKAWGDQKTKFDWASAAKPVVSTLLFFAVAEGRLASVDDLIDDWGWALTPEDQFMTFRHLANNTSGYARGEGPGVAWAYNDYAIKLYDLTLQNVFQQSLNDAALQRLSALGFQDGSLFSSREGLGLSTTPRDFARIGWWWLNKGNWNGIQLLPQSYFETYMKPQVPGGLPRTTIAATDYLGVGTVGGGTDQTPLGPGIYGFNWWFNAPVGNGSTLTWPDAPADTFQANGHWNGEVLTVIPSLGLVAAWQGTGSDPARFNEDMNTALKILTQAVIVIDVAPPSVSLIAPASGASVSGTVTVAADASDDVGVAGVQFELDGIALGEEDTMPLYEIMWDTMAVANGSHDLSAVARDAAGNIASSESVVVTVDNAVDTVAPSVPTLLNLGAVSSFQIDLTWSESTDDVGVVGYQIYRDGVMIATVPTTAYSDVGLSPATTYEYAVTALDASGNESERSMVLSVTTLNEPTSSILLNDRFDRPDADVVGAGWIEVESQSITQLVNGALIFEAVDDSYRPLIQHSFASNTTGRLRWSFDLNFQRTGAEGTYAFWMQLGQSSLMSAVAPKVSGVAVNLVWGSLNQGLTTDEGFGYVVDGVVTQIATVHGGPTPVTVEVDLEQRTYSVEVAGRQVVSIPFENDVVIDTVRFFSHLLNRANFASREIDNVLIEYEPGILLPPDTVAPSVPTSLNPGAVLSSQIDLTWNESTDDVGVVGYQVYRDGVMIATVPTTAYSDVGLSPATTYEYAVTALDASGNESERSVVLSVTTSTEPISSILLDDRFDRPDADVVGAGWIEVESQSITQLVNGALIFEAVDDSYRPLIHHSFASNTTGRLRWSFDLNFQRTGAEGTYAFWMQLGQSSLMSAVAPKVSGVAVNLVWGSLNQGLTTDEGFGYVVDGVVTQIAMVRGGPTPVTVEVDLEQRTYSVEVAGLQVVSIPFENDVVIDTVRFFSHLLNRANFASREIDNVLIEYEPGVLLPPDTVAPSVPTSLNPGAVSSSQIDLTWNESTDDVGVVGYQIYRDGVMIATVPTTAYSDVGLSPATTYEYAVTALDASGNESDRSMVLSVTTSTEPTSSILLNDRFDRPDADVVGAGWIEVESQSVTQLVNGALIFEAVDDSYRPLIYHSFAPGTTGRLRWSFDLNFQRTGAEGTYAFWMQLGQSSLMSAVAPKVSGVAVNLVWGSLNQGLTTDEGFGYVVDGVVTQIATVHGGPTPVTVEVDLGQRTYSVEVAGLQVVSIPFENDVVIDTVRFFSHLLNRANFASRELDNVFIEYLP